MVWRLSRMKRPNRNIPLAQQLGWLMVILLLLFMDPLAQQLGVMTGKSLGGLSTVVLKRSWRMLLPLKLLSPKVPKENNLIRGLLKLRSLHRYVVVFCFNDWKKTCRIIETSYQNSIFLSLGLKPQEPVEEQAPAKKRVWLTEERGLVDFFHLWYLMKNSFIAGQQTEEPGEDQRIGNLIKWRKFRISIGQSCWSGC